jgi:hypothetical protein
LAQLGTQPLVVVDQRHVRMLGRLIDARRVICQSVQLGDAFGDRDRKLFSLSVS